MTSTCPLLPWLDLDLFRRAVDARMRRDSISYGRLSQMAGVRATTITHFLSGCEVDAQALQAIAHALLMPLTDYEND